MTQFNLILIPKYFLIINLSYFYHVKELIIKLIVQLSILLIL